MWRSCHKEYNVKHEQWQSYNQKKSVTDVRKLRLTDGRAGGQKDKLQTQWSLGGVLLRCRHKNWWTFLVNKVMIFRIRVQNHQKKRALLLYLQDGKKYGRLFIKMINYFSVKIWIFEISKITFIKIFSLQIVNLTIRYHLLKFLYIR